MEPKKRTEVFLADRKNGTNLFQVKGRILRMNAEFSKLLDRVSTFAGVFLFCLGGCLSIDNQPILAATFFTFAVAFPSIVGPSLDRYRASFGKPPIDDSDDREGK